MHLNVCISGIYYFSIYKYLVIRTFITCSFTGEHDVKAFDVTSSLKEAAAICEIALRSVQRQRFWYLLSGFILFIPLIWSITLNCMNTSLSIDIGLNVLRIFLTAVLCYTLFMSSIWNSVEKNALRAGCLAIEIYLKKLYDDRN